MKIEFSAKDKPQEWFGTMARQFGSPVVNNSFRIPASIGEGVFRQIYFFKGFTLTYLYFRLFKPLEFERHSVFDAQLVPVMFFSQDDPFEQNIEEQKKRIGYHTSNGIFMPSPQIESKWLIPENTKGFQVTLTFEKTWLLQTLKYVEGLYINRLLVSGKPFYLFESLLPSMKTIILSIHELIHTETSLQVLKLHQQAMELFNLFLGQVEKRTSRENATGINASDIEKIFCTRKRILENLTSMPSVKQLAAEAGMSVSKMQKCFQQVFGKSISRYALSEKMQLAKQLLDTKKYAVSEVGYRLGYSNLSHFSEVFKSEFGLNPKTYLTSK